MSIRMGRFKAGYNMVTWSLLLVYNGQEIVAHYDFDYYYY